MGKLDKVKKIAKDVVEMSKADAAKVLKKLDPTKYVDDVEAYQNWTENMKPAVKKQYEQALDVTFGDKNKRAWDTQGINRSDLIKAEEKLKNTKKEYEFNTSTNSDYKFNDEGDIIDETPKGTTVEAIHKKSNKTVGQVPTLDKGSYNVVDDINSDDPNGLVSVDKNHRRKGIASGMYRAVEEDTGLPMQPSGSRTVEGKALWNEANQYDYDLRIKNLVDKRDEILKTLEKEKNPEKIKELKYELSKADEYIPSIKEEIIKDNAQYRPFGNARHSDAAFDPRTKNSPYVKAAIAGAAIGAATLGSSNEAEASPASKIASKLSKGAAEKVLQKYDTVDKVKALRKSGNTAELEKYLGALDVEQGTTRAADMGFPKENWYHGSPFPEIEAFDNDKKFTGSGGTSEGYGTYFSSNPNAASDYATGDQGTVYNVKLKQGNYISEQTPIKPSDRKFFEKIITSANDWENSVINYGDENPKKALKLAIDAAMSSSNKLEGMHELANTLYNGDLNKFGKIVNNLGISGVYEPNKYVGLDVKTVLDPSNIRSKNAAFDKRFADSDYLLALNKPAYDKGLIESGIEKAGQGLGYLGAKAKEFASNKATEAIMEKLKAANESAPVSELKKQAKELATQAINADPGLGLPSIADASSFAMNALTKPQEGLQMLANYATGNDINSGSYAPAISSIISKLPQQYQPSIGAQKDIGTIADFALDPLNAVTGGGSKALAAGIKEAKLIKTSDVANKIMEIEHAGQIAKQKNAAQKLGEAVDSGAGKTVVIDTAVKSGNTNPVIFKPSRADMVADAEKTSMQAGGDAYIARRDAALEKVRAAKKTSQGSVE